MSSMPGILGKMFLLLLAGALLLELLVACSKGEVELKNTVSAYTKMLAQSLAKPNSNQMEFFTTPEERNRIDSYIMFLGKDGKVIVNNLKSLQFVSVQVEKDKKNAQVTTNEEWTFHYVDEKSRQPISKEEAIRYRNIYHLINEQGHWVVNKVDMNETQAPVPAPSAPSREKSPENDMSRDKKNTKPSEKSKF